MNRSDILKARRAVNKAVKLCAPLVVAQELTTIQYRLKKLLLDCPKEIRTREDTVKSLIRKADNIFSQYIRLEAADFEGWVYCFTCGKKVNWTNIDNGHFIKRQYEFLRFNKKNCHPQCTDCNWLKQGNDAVYEKNLIKMYGQDTVNWLHANKKHKKFTRWELKVLIEQCEKDVGYLKAMKNIN